jgi:hypothetical protein
MSFHRSGKKPGNVSLNGKPAYSIFDGKAGILQVSFPDTGEERRLVISSQRDPNAR